MSNTTAVQIADAADLFKKLSIKNIRDIRALDVDLLIVMANGERIIVSGGAVQALTQPDWPMVFADGTVTLAQLFQKIEEISLSPEANLTASSQEITRYNRNNAQVKKPAGSADEDAPAKSDPVEKAGKTRQHEPVVEPVRVAPKEAAPVQGQLDNGTTTQRHVADTEVNSDRSDNWNWTWPTLAGIFGGLLALTGKTGSNDNPTEASSAPSRLTGVVALGKMTQAEVLVYDENGRLLNKGGKAVALNDADGSYSVDLATGYKGLVTVVVRDTNSGGNYYDEATGEFTDLDADLRAVLVVGGGAQTAHVTALTELAARKAGLAVGEDSVRELIAAVGREAAITEVKKAMAAVADVFEVTDLLTSTPITTNEGAEPNAQFAALSQREQNHGLALALISGLQAAAGKANAGDTLTLLASVLNYSDRPGFETTLIWRASEGSEMDASAVQDLLYSGAPNVPFEPTQAYPSLQAYIEDNQIAMRKPVVLARGESQNVVLDREDLVNGALTVQGTVGSTAVMKLKAGDVTLSLTAQVLDVGGVVGGQATFKLTQDQLLELGQQLTTITVTASTTDRAGNTRTAVAFAQLEATVAVMIDTVLPSARVVGLELEGNNDSHYAERPAGHAEGQEAAYGSTDDGVTNINIQDVRITLNDRALGQTERIEFSTNGGQTWFRPNGLQDISTEGNARTVFLAAGVRFAEGENKLLARVVQIKDDSRYGNDGLGNYSPVYTTPQPLATVDTVNPGNVSFVIDGDDGISSTDNVTVVAGRSINLVGSTPDAVVRYRTGQGAWRDAPASKQLVLLGDSVDGNGKLVVQTHQIDLAGNVSETLTRTFVVDTSGVIQHALALVRASDAVAEKAAIDTARAGLSANTAVGKASFSRLGIVGVTDDNLRAVIQGIASVTDESKVDTQAGLQQVVTEAIAAAKVALDRIKNYNGQTQPPEVVPTLADFVTLGVDGVTADNLPLVLSIFKTLPDSASDTIGEVAAAVAALQAVQALADGRSNTGLLELPTSAQYAALGIAVNENEARLLGSVLDAKNPADVDTLEKIQAMADVVQRLLAVADDRGSGPRPLTAADFELLGIAGVDDSVDFGNLADVLNAIAAKSPSEVDTLSEVRAVVDGLIGDLKVIIDYATDSEFYPKPTLDNYARGGLAALVPNVTTLDAVNSAVDALAPTDVGTWRKVQAIAESYNRVLDLVGADLGLASDPAKAADYARIGMKAFETAFPDRVVDGVSTPNPLKDEATTLLNSLVTKLTTADVDRVSELKALADVPTRVMQLAAGLPVTPPLTVADLTGLGLSDVTADNLAVVLSGIAGSADTGVEANTPRKLQTLANEAKTAQNVISAYAESNDPTREPQLEDYKALGVTDVTDLAMAGAVNSALATLAVKGQHADSPDEVKAIAAAYRAVFDHANGAAADTDASNDPTAAQYGLLGVDVTANAGVADLLNDAVAGLERDDVNNASELATLAAHATAVTQAALGKLDALGADPLPGFKAAMEALGVDGLTDSTLAAVLSALVASPDDLSVAKDLAALQALADEAKSAQESIWDYADLTPPPAPEDGPSIEDYAAIGITGLTPELRLALNAVLATEAIDRSDLASPAALQAMADAYQSVMDEANGPAPDADPQDNPSAADYATLGIDRGADRGIEAGTPLDASALKLLNSVIGPLVVEDVNSPAELQDLADRVAAVMALAAGIVTDPVAAPISANDLNALGLSDVTDANLAAVRAAIAASPNDGSAVDTLNELQAVARDAIAARAKIMAYADSPTPTGAPDADTYKAIGLVDADGERLSDIAVASLNSVLARPQVDGADVSSPEQLQAMLDALTEVRAAADGQAPTDGSLSPEAALLDADTWALLGLSGLEGSDDQTEARLRAFDAVVDRLNLPADQAVDVARLQAALDAVAKIQNLANGVATAGGVPLAQQLSADDLTALGLVNGSSPIARAMSDSLDRRNFADVGHPAALQAQVDAWRAVLNEANEPATLVGQPTNADNTPDNEPAVNPTAADYRAIGVTLPGVTDVAAPDAATPDADTLALMNDVLRRKEAAQVDSVADLDALAAAVQRVMAQVARDLPSGTTDLPVSIEEAQAWAADFAALGVSGLDIGHTAEFPDDPGNVGQILAALANQANDGSTVRTVGAVQTLMDNILRDLLTIKNYADGKVDPDSGVVKVPSKATYDSVGIRNVTADNVSAINAALASEQVTGADAATRSQVQGIVNAYNLILAEANGPTADDVTPAADPTLQTYARIGVKTAALTQADGITPRSDVLALLNDGLGEQTASQVSTPAQIDALAATAAEIVRLATPAAAAGTSLTLSALKSFGMDNFNESTPARASAALNSLVDAVRKSGAPDKVNSLNELQDIVDGFRVLQDHAEGVAGAPTPAATDYAKAGAPLTDTSASRASTLSLLNDAVARVDAGKVDSVKEVGDLVSVVERLMATARGETPVPALTIEDLKDTLGLSSINANSLPALLNRIKASPDNGSEIENLSELQALATQAAVSMQKIRTYADTPLEAYLPSLTDYTNIGVAIPGPLVGDENTASQADYLNAVNSALASVVVDSADAGTPAKVQAIVDAARRVLDAADGVVNTDPEQLPSRADFEALGLSKDDLDAAGAGGLTLLQGAVDAARPVEVNSPDKIKHLLDLIKLVALEAAGQPQTSPPLTPAVLEELGVDFTGLDSASNWPAMLSAIQASPDNGSGIDSLQKLQDLVTGANDAMGIIRTYAGASDPSRVPAPEVSTYAAIGLVNTDARNPDPNQHVITPLVTAANLSAINAALATGPVGASQANTPAQVRAIVDAYQGILDEANGSAPDADTADNPTQLDYTRIGVAVPKLTTGLPTTGANAGKADANVLSLLNSVIGNLEDGAVDKPAEIDTLGALVNKVMAQAAIPNNDTSTAPKVTIAELDALGVRDVDGNTLATLETTKPGAAQAALYAIRVSADDGSDVNTLSKLNTKVAEAVDAYERILAYAETGAGEQPSLADYAALGLVIPLALQAEPMAADMLGAVLRTAAVGGEQVDSPNEVQAILDAYARVLQAADGNRDNAGAALPSQNDLIALGVNLGATANNAHPLRLLQSAIDAQPADHLSVASPAAIEALNTLAQTLLGLANKPGQTLPSADALPISKAQLQQLGLNLGSTVDNAGVAAGLAAVQAKTDLGLVDTVGELQALFNAAVTAQAKIAAYAANPDNTDPTKVPTPADFAAIGMVDTAGRPTVTDANIAAINSALATPAIAAENANSPAEIAAIVNAYNAVLAGATPTGAAPTKEQYAAIGVEDVTTNNLPLLNAALKAIGPDAAKDAAALQAAVTAADKVIAAANGPSGSITPADQLPTADDFEALGVDMGGSSAANDPDGSGAALLGAVIDKKPLSAVSTPAQIETLADVVNKVMDTAAGKLVSPALTPADLLALGIDITGKTPAQQAAILAAIATSPDDGSALESLAELAELADKAVLALAKVTRYAQSNNEADLPSVQDYLDMGVSGVTDDQPASGSTPAQPGTLAAVNAALGSGNVTGTEADSQAKVQAIADTYAKVLDLADGTRNHADNLPALPSAAEINRLGASAPIDPDTLLLLQTAIDATSRDRVDTPADINLIAESAAKMLALAGNTDTPTITLEDFIRLGVSALDEDTLPAAIEAVKALNSAAAVNTSSELDAVIEEVLKDLALIKRFAEGEVNPETGVLDVPNQGNYERAGVSGLGAEGAPTVDMLNAAVQALNRADVDTRSKLQGVFDAYQHVLDAADGTPGNAEVPVSADELRRIGVDPAKVPDAATPAGAAALGLLQGALDAQPADHTTLNTPAKIGDLAALAAKVVAAANGGSTPPTLAELEKLGVTGLTPETLAAVQAAIKANPIDGVNSLDDLQTMADTMAAIRRMTDADPSNDPATPPSAADYAALGVTGIVDAPANNGLLNDVVADKPYGSVDSPNEIKTLSDIVNKVVDLANDVQPAPVLGAADLAKIGLTGITPESLPALLAAIAAGSPADISSLDDLQAIAEAAKLAQIKIEDYAENAALAPVTDGAPGVDDFAAVGVTGVRDAATADGPANLAAINAALSTQAADGTDRIGADLAKLPSDLQALVDSYDKLLNLANGVADAMAPAAPADGKPLAQDYANIGADIGAAATDAVNLSLLNGAIDAKPVADIATPAAIDALADKVNHVLAYARGTDSTPPTVDELAALGIDLGDLDDSQSQLPAVLAALAAVPDADASSIATPAGLQALVDKAIAAQDKISAYAAAQPAPLDADKVPSAEDYAAIGAALPTVAGSTPAEVLAAVNAVLASSTVGADEVATPAQLADIGAAVAKVLAAADGTVNTTAPDALLQHDDVVALGLPAATADKLTDGSPNLGLLNQVVDRATDAQVNTPQGLGGLADKVNALMDLAALPPGTKPTAEQLASLSAADLAALGLPAGLTPAQAAAVLSAVAAGDPADIATLDKLLAVADAAVEALDWIAEYAATNADNRVHPLTVADFDALGIVGVRDTAAGSGLPATLAAVKNALAGPITRTQADSPKEVQDIVDAYARILQAADGSLGNADDAGQAGLPTQQDFDRIGADISALSTTEGLSAAQSANAVELLGTLVDAVAADRVDTLADLKTLAELARKIVENALGNDSPDYALTPADFTGLGINGVTDGPDGNLAAVIAAIAERAAEDPALTLDNLDTLAELADAVATVTNIPVLETVAADDIVNREEWQAGVVLRGTVARDSIVTLTLPGITAPIVITSVAAEIGATWTTTLSRDQLTLMGAGAAASEGLKTLTLTATRTGVTSKVVTYNITVDTLVDTPRIRLNSDTGRLTDDEVTGDKTVLVEGLEPGGVWYYSINGGTSWSGEQVTGDASTGSFTINTDGPYAASRIRVRQKDAALNMSDVTGNDVSWRIDTAKPDAPAVALSADVSAGGATAGEASRMAGLGTVTAESGSHVVLTFTNRTNPADVKVVELPFFESTGTTVAIVLSAEDQTTLGDGTIEVSAVATDLAGNASDAGLSSFVLDRVAPAAHKVADDKTATITRDTVTYTVTFGEALVGAISPANFKVVQTGTDTVTGTIDSATYAAGSDQKQVTVVVRPNADLADAVLRLQLLGTGLTDAAGNPVADADLGVTALDTAATSNGAQRVDTLAPTITGITDSVVTTPDVTAAAFNFRVTFSEALNTAPTAANFSVTNGGSIASVTAASDTPNTYVVRVIPPASNAGATLTLALIAGSLTDAVGNPMASVTDLGSLGGAQAIDTVAPTVSAYSPADGSVTELPPVGSITLTFTEPVKAGAGSIVLTPDEIDAEQGKVVQVIDITNTAAVSIVGNSVTITPPDNLAKLTHYTLTMAAGVLRDLAGNNHAGLSSSGSFVYDFTTTDSNMKLEKLTGDDVVNALENGASGGLTLTGNIVGSAAQKAAYSNASFSAVLTAEGHPDVLVTDIAYTSAGGNAGAWTGTIAANTLQDGVTYTLKATARATTTSGGITAGALSNAQADILVDTSVARPTISLKTDSVGPVLLTATGATDGVTNDAVINIIGLEPGASWQVSLNGGAYGAPGSGGTLTADTWATLDAGATTATFSLPTGITYDAGKVKFRQKDAAGNTSEAASNAIAWTVDTSIPTQATLTVPADIVDGATAAETEATAGVLTVKAGEAGLAMTVRLVNRLDATKSVDIDGFVSTGANQPILLSAAQRAQLGEGTIDVTVIATDKAGNASDVAMSSFVLDTVAPVVDTVTDGTVAGVTKDAIDFYVTFSEALRSTPTTGHFSATNGAVTSVGVVAGVANQYKVTVTPTADVASGNVALTLKGTDGTTQLFDAAGNAVAGSTDLSA
ncbi:Ig-like domain-containing protein, partial [Sphaerotilus mobilis]